MTSPRLLIIDLNGTIVTNSRDSSSRFYHLLHPADVVLKPRVLTAFELINALEVPYVIATKQTAIGTGKISAEDFDSVIHEVRTQLTIPRFAHITPGEVYIEPKAVDKRDVFARIIRDFNDENWIRQHCRRLLNDVDEHGRFRPVLPREMCVIDDSQEEIEAAWIADMSVMRVCNKPHEHYECPDLYAAICHLFNLIP